MRTNTVPALTVWNVSSVLVSALEIQYIGYICVYTCIYRHQAKLNHRMFQMTEVTTRNIGFRTSADGDKKALSVRRYEAKPPENLELVSQLAQNLSRYSYKNIFCKISIFQLGISIKDKCLLIVLKQYTRILILYLKIRMTTFRKCSVSSYGYKYLLLRIGMVLNVNRGQVLVNY